MGHDSMATCYLLCSKLKDMVEPGRGAVLLLLRLLYARFNCWTRAADILPNIRSMKASSRSACKTLRAVGFNETAGKVWDNPAAHGPAWNILTMERRELGPSHWDPLPLRTFDNGKNPNLKRPNEE